MQSMTGYGKAEKSFQNKNISVEIRALNSKNLDLKTKMPSVYREKEMAIRKQLSKTLRRGKIDFNLNIENLEEKPNNQINAGILSGYVSQLKNLHPGADETQLLVAALRLPDVLQAVKEDFDEAEWQHIWEVVEEATQKLIQFRMDEGLALEKDLKVQLDKIQTGLHKVASLDRQRIDRIKKRLQEALEQLKIEIDENRFEQELIYYLEKFDINEEKIRLQNHLEYFTQELASDNPMKGKKLGFISQEIGREINTIGSKANDSDIQREVVKMKDALEKIKEQILNVL